MTPFNTAVVYDPMSIAYKRHQLSVPLELFFERGSLTPLADVLEHRRGKEGWKADDARMARVDRTQLYDRVVCRRPASARPTPPARSGPLWLNLVAATTRRFATGPTLHAERLERASGPVSREPCFTTSKSKLMTSYNQRYSLQGPWEVCSRASRAHEGSRDLAWGSLGAGPPPITSQGPVVAIGAMYGHP